MDIRSFDGVIVLGDPAAVEWADFARKNRIPMIIYDCGPDCGSAAALRGPPDLDVAAAKRKAAIRKKAKAGRKAANRCRP